MNLENFPAPFLGGPLKGKDQGAAGKRNTDGAARAFANCKAYGYVPVAAPAAGSSIVLDGESKPVKVDADGRAFVDVLSRKGEIIAAWFGYPGSEHLMIVHCVLCGKTAAVYNSHVRRGSGHTGCTVRGKAERVAAVENMTGAKVSAPGPQIQPNGSTPKGEPVTADATEAAETADKTRTAATVEAAESRPEPEPEAQPPKTGKNQEDAPELTQNQRDALDLIASNPGRVIAYQRGSRVKEFKKINGNVEHSLTRARLIVEGSRPVKVSEGVKFYAWELTEAGQEAVKARGPLALRELLRLDA